MTRKAISIFSLLIFITGLNYAQNNARNLKGNIELNQFITTSGFSAGTEVYIKIAPDNKKNLAFGVFFDNEYKKITGISLHHEFMLWQSRFTQSSLIQPHLTYNFIYRKTTIPEVGPDLKSNGDLATYTSLEHHVGMGLKLNLFERIYLDCDLGFGAYFGSIKKPTAFNAITGEVKGKDGLGMIAQIGIGYNIF